MEEKTNELFNRIKRQRNITLFQLVIYNLNIVFTVKSSNKKLMFIGSGKDILRLCYSCILDSKFNLLCVDDENKVIVELKGVYL